MKRRVAKLMSIFLMAVIMLSLLPCHIVLCVSEGGSIALEYSDSDGGCQSECGSEHSHDVASGKKRVFVSKDGCCGQCVDIPLPRIELAEVVTQTKQPVPARTYIAAVSLDRQYHVSFDKHLALGSTAGRVIASLYSTAPLVLRI